MLSKKGWPDRTIFGPDRLLFFIEFKKPDRSLSPHQKKWEKILTFLGFKYYICTSFAEAKQILDSQIEVHKND